MTVPTKKWNCLSLRSEILFARIQPRMYAVILSCVAAGTKYFKDSEMSQTARSTGAVYKEFFTDPVVMNNSNDMPEIPDLKETSLLSEHSFAHTTIYSLLVLFSFLPTTLIFARPLLKTTFPVCLTVVTNLTSSKPSESLLPIFHICATKVSPGSTGDANLAANSLMLAGSEPPRALNRAWHDVFQEYNPCI
jgi:hypothetical protein